MPDPVRFGRRRTDVFAAATSSESSGVPPDAGDEKMSMPVLNGQSANTAMRGAVFLLGLIIVAVTVVVVQGKDIPSIFTTLGGLLAGFVIGGRVVTTDVAREVKKGDGDGTAR